jgi:hypothetical protein
VSTFRYIMAWVLLALGLLSILSFVLVLAIGASPAGIVGAALWNGGFTAACWWGSHKINPPAVQG